MYHSEVTQHMTTSISHVIFGKEWEDKFKINIFVYTVTSGI